MPYSGVSAAGFFPPRVHEAPAASKLAMMAKSSAACRPALNGAEMSEGKNPRPVRAACWAWGSVDSTCGPSSSATGLYPSREANRVETGERCEIFKAATGGTPCCVSPW